MSNDDKVVDRLIWFAAEASNPADRAAAISALGLIRSLDGPPAANDIEIVEPDKIIKFLVELCERQDVSLEESLAAGRALVRALAGAAKDLGDFAMRDFDSVAYRSFLEA